MARIYVPINQTTVPGLRFFLYPMKLQRAGMIPEKNKTKIFFKNKTPEGNLECQDILPD